MSIIASDPAVRVHWYRCPNCKTVMWCKQADRYQCITQGCYRAMLYLHYDEPRPAEASHEFQVWNPGSYFNHRNKKYGNPIFGPTRLDLPKATKE